MISPSALGSAVFYQNNQLPQAFSADIKVSSAATSSLTMPPTTSPQGQARGGAEHMLHTAVNTAHYCSSANSSPIEILADVTKTNLSGNFVYDESISKMGPSQASIANIPIDGETLTSNASSLQRPESSNSKALLLPIESSSKVSDHSTNLSDGAICRIGIENETINFNSVNICTAQMTSNGYNNGNDGACLSQIYNTIIANQSSMTDDSRALQLALSMMRLNESDSAHSSFLPASLPSIQTASNFGHMQNLHQLQVHNDNDHDHMISTTAAQISNQNYDLNAISAAVAVAAAASSSYGETNNHDFGISNSQVLNQFTLIPTSEERSKKSQNMTECVPVPSSEHVAEIVGRQGCKIKALRAKTNTYIKTPVRNEEPVFVVTGRKEDVAKAKREILSAAEHFSLIRATRKPSLNNSNIGSSCANVGTGGNGNACSHGNSNKASAGPPTISGQVTIHVLVPYRVVGLVVGPKGATIKNIQRETQTYIVTPSRDKEPIFEVTGLPENVHSARKQIEAHIAFRTGSQSIGLSNTESTLVHANNTLNQILNEDCNRELLMSFYKSSGEQGFEYIENSGLGSSVIDSTTDLASADNVGINFANLASISGNNEPLLGSQISKMSETQNVAFMKALDGTVDLNKDISNVMHQHNLQKELNHQTFLAHTQTNHSEFHGVLNQNLKANKNIQKSNCADIGSTKTENANRSCSSSASSTTSSKSAPHSGSTNSSRPDLINIWKGLGDSIDVDEGIAESPNIWTVQQSSKTTTTSVHCTPPSTSISPTDSVLCDLSTANVQNDGNSFIQQQQQQQQRHKQLTTSGVLQTSLNGDARQFTGLENNFNNSTVVPTARRECLVCCEKEVTAALVPCGHNMFCMDCANRICSNRICPVCSHTVYHAMRILA